MERYAERITGFSVHVRQNSDIQNMRDDVVKDDSVN